MTRPTLMTIASVTVVLLLAVQPTISAEPSGEAPSDAQTGFCLDGDDPTDLTEIEVVPGAPLGDMTLHEPTRITGSDVVIAGQIRAEPGHDICVEAESFELLPGASLCTEAAPDQQATMSDDYELVGADGVDAGGIYILLEGAASEFKLSPGAIICTGDGGAGGTVIHTVPDLTHVQTCNDLQDASLYGGAGGDAGKLVISTPVDARFDVAPASVLLGQGGTGGHALLVGTAYSADTFGGAGGESRALLNDGTVPPEWLAQGQGGDGGNAVSIVCVPPPLDIDASVNVPVAQGIQTPALLEPTPAGGEPNGVPIDFLVNCSIFMPDKTCLLSIVKDYCHDYLADACPIGEDGSDAYAYAQPGSDGINGQTGDDGDSSVSYSVGAGVSKGGPGISASANCGSNDRATPGDPGVSAPTGGHATATGGPGKWGDVMGGEGGDAEARGGEGGNGGIGGDGGAADVIYHPICQFEKEKAAAGGNGGNGGRGGPTTAYGGSGGDSLLLGGKGGDATGYQTSGGPGGEGGNGGDPDSEEHCMSAIIYTACQTETAAQGRYGCGGHGGGTGELNVEEGTGGHGAGDLYQGSDGTANPETDGAEEGAPGGPGAGRPRECSTAPGSGPATETHDQVHMTAFDDPDFYEFETIALVVDPSDTDVFGMKDDLVNFINSERHQLDDGET